MLNPTHLKPHAFAIATAWCASSALTVRPAAAQAQTVCQAFTTATLDCGHFSTHSIANNSFIIENNDYNDIGQCIRWKPDGSFCVSNAPPTVGFPNILQGNVFSNGPTAGWSPRQISSIVTWPVTWTAGEKPTPTGAWKAILDFWMTTYNPAGINVFQPDGTELIVSLSASPGSTPDGLNMLDRAFVGGATWNVYAGRFSNPSTGTSWNHIVYVGAFGYTGTNMDFTPFFTNAQGQTGTGTNAPLGACKGATPNSSQCLDPSWYVTSVQAGFEVRGGGVGLNSNGFTSIPNGTPQNAVCGRIASGTGLPFVNPVVDSCDARYELVLQSDGNLVEHNTSLQTVWASGTTNPSFPSSVFMQSDGNLVIKDASNNVLWATGTFGNPGAYTRLQTDGNLVVYSTNGTPLWSAKGGLTSNAMLLNGGWTKSYDDDFTLGLQGGNFLLIVGRQVLWSTGTTTGHHVVMQGDGNLVLYDAGNHALWSSGTFGNPGAHLVLTNDGNLIIYSASGVVLWQSNTGGN